MNSKYQAIINTPAMTVPAMSTEEIRNTLLEASLAYVRKTISLDTLVLLASKIQSFMGLRGEDNTKISDILSNLTELSAKRGNTKRIDLFINTQLLS